MTSLLDLCGELAVTEVPAGHTIITEGERSPRLYVLVSGALDVRKGGVRVARIDRPGACFGEISLLLGGPHSASVVTLEPSRFHVIDDGLEQLRRHPELLLGIAALLAERLQLVTAFLADIKRQYGDGEGNLAMVDSVLDALTRHAGSAEPGSEREPDPPY